MVLTVTILPECKYMIMENNHVTIYQPEIILIEYRCLPE